MFRRLLLPCLIVFWTSAAGAEPWWLSQSKPHFRVPANIVGADDRMWLTPEAGEKLGLSSAEVLRIQDSTGFIACRGSIGSAALVYDNQHVVTAIHVVFDHTTQKFRERCAFYAHDPMKRYIPHPIIITQGSYRAGTTDVHRNPEQDWAIFKLTRAVARGEPFAIGDARAWRVGGPIIAISSVQSDKPAPQSRENPGLPLAHRCTIRELGVRIDQRLFRSDCDVEQGGSGGISLARVNGQLVMAGIFVRSSSVQKGTPYSRFNSSVAIVVADQVINAIFDLVAAQIRPSRLDRHALLAGEIGDELDENTRLIALRTETRALSDFYARSAVRWQNGKIEGYVLPMPHNGPMGAIGNCRPFVHAIIYAPDKMKSSKGQVCREKNGAWAVVRRETQTISTQPATADEQLRCATSRPAQQETPSLPCR